MLVQWIYVLLFNREGMSSIPGGETLNFCSIYYFTHLLLNILVNVSKYVKKNFFDVEKSFLY